MCVYMHSRFVENHPIWILEDRPFVSEVVLSQRVSSRMRTRPGTRLRRTSRVCLTRQCQDLVQELNLLQTRGPSYA
jgi:hypothetical protein